MVFKTQQRRACLLSLLIACLLITQLTSLKWQRSAPLYRRHKVYLSQESQDGNPPLNSMPPRNILLLVEPTPFGYVSGYANRFKEMIYHLKNAGDKLEIVTPDRNPEHVKDYLGFPVSTNRGWELAMYKQVTLSYDFAGQTPRIIRKFRPDLIHVSTPSALVWPACIWAWWYRLPLVMSYHTNFPKYAETYVGFIPGIKRFANFLLNIFHKQADLTLCTSPQLLEEIAEAGIPLSLSDVWQKGINSQRFNPAYRDSAMRMVMSDGNPDAPLLLYAGRLGFEKRLDRLKTVLDKNPGARLAFVGKGPALEKLKVIFEGYPVKFVGELSGDQLSQAFASADIFVMPSDSETLGFVVLEAMASGVPAVCVAAGGLIDIVENGKTGFLTENKDDMIEFSARVGEILKDSTLRKTQSLAARQYAESWSWESATSKLRNVQYSRAIENHRSKMAKWQDAYNKREDALLQRANLYRPDLA